jgi:hypothetical protein
MTLPKFGLRLACKAAGLQASLLLLALAAMSPMYYSHLVL